MHNQDICEDKKKVVGTTRSQDGIIIILKIDLNNDSLSVFRLELYLCWCWCCVGLGLGARYVKFLFDDLKRHLL